VLQIVGKDHVFLQEGPRFKVFQRVHRVVQRLLGHGGVDGPEGGQQLVLVQGRVVVPLDVRAVDVGVAQGLSKELQNSVFVAGFGEGHKITSFTYQEAFRLVVLLNHNKNNNYQTFQNESFLEHVLPIQAHINSCLE